MVFTGIGVVILYYMWQIQGAAYDEQCAISGIAADQCSLSDKLIDDYRNAKASWLVTITLIYMFSNIIRAFRWRLLLEPLGHSITWYNAVFGLMTGYFVNTALPRFGEFVRAGVLTRYEAVSFDKSFGTIVVERIVDMLCLLSMIGLGFILQFDNLWSYIKDNLAISFWTISIIGLIVLAGLALFLVAFKSIKKRKDSISSPMIKKTVLFIEGFMEGIGSVRKMPNTGMFVFYSVIIWVCYYLMHYLAFFAYEPTSHLGPADGLLVFDFGALGVVFPSPGGMGSYHAMVVEALKILQVDALYGFTFAMITFFTLTIFCNVAFGLISLILLPVFNKRKHDSTTDKGQDIRESE